MNDTSLRSAGGRQQHSGQQHPGQQRNRQRPGRQHPRKYEAPSLKSETVDVVVLSFFVVMLACLAISIVSVIARGFWSLPGKVLVASTIDIGGLVVCITMAFATLSDTVRHRLGKPGYLFMWLVFVVALTLTVDCLAWMVDGVPRLATMSFCLNTALFVVCEMPLVLFWLFLQTQTTLSPVRKQVGDTVIYTMQIVWWAMVLVNCFTGMMFNVDETGAYIRGAFYAIHLIPAGVSLLVIAVTVLLVELPVSLKAVLLSFEVLSVAALALQLLAKLPSILYAVPLVTLLMVYGDMYMQRGTAIAKMQEELADQRYAVMVSQIQPHFLYNSLTAIMGIPGNPPETREAIAQFGKYLRANLDSLSVHTAIPFMSEMDHVKNYVALEQLRFGERLEVRYNLKLVAFFIPALSVQVLAENAIKHGLTAREEGGRLTISSRRTDDGYVEIVVADDGVGFDPDAPPPDDGRTHVGLDNVRDRLRTMMGATLEIWSELGMGTVVTIRIPCENADTPQGANKELQP